MKPKSDQTMDGVLIEGEMTYNVTAHNLHREITDLK